MREKTKATIVSLIVIAMLLSALPTTASASAPAEPTVLNPKIDPYLHMMLGDENPVGLNSMMLSGIEMISVFLETNGDSNARARLEANGVVVRSVIGNIMTANVPRNAIEVVANMPEIVYIEGDKPMQLQMDVSRPEILADDVHRTLYTPAGGSTTPVTGKGVIVGIIDTGIDFTHPDFWVYAEDGITPQTRILKLWDQAPVPGTSDLGVTNTVPYGREYFASNINTALASANPHLYVAQKDTNGHGTRVAGIAAGGGRNNAAYRGVAPDADIVFVKKKPYAKESPGDNWTFETSVVDGMNYIHNYAKLPEVMKPCVISISLGNDWGPHDGTSYLERWIDALTAQGTTIVVAAGNEGDAGHHLSVCPLSASPVYKEFIIEPGSGDYIFYHHIVYPSNPEVEISLITPEGTEIIKPGSNANERNIDIEKQEFGGYTRWLIRMEGSFPPSPSWNIETWMIKFHTAAYQVQFDSWMIFNSGYDKISYTESDPNNTIQNPGNSMSAITVGAYNTKQSTNGELSEFSSRGTTRHNIPKPDITAPGNWVKGIASKDVGLGTLYSDYTSYERLVNNQLSKGTSFAAPHVAGAVALMLQLQPDLTPAQVKTRLQDAARTDGFTGDEPEPNLWGAGKVDALAITGLIGLTAEGQYTADTNIGLTISPDDGGWRKWEEMRFMNDNDWRTVYPSSPIQSSHPVYTTDTNTIYNIDAVSFRIHFNIIDTEITDYIYLKDSSGQTIQSFSGQYPNGVWSNIISGNYVRIDLVISPMNTEGSYGYIIDRYMCYLEWSQWEQYAEEKSSWIIPGGDGNKKVYCQARDNLGNIIQTDNSIILDTINPIAILFSPFSGETVRGVLSITGTAMDSNLNYYKIEYGIGSSPSTWNQIGSLQYSEVSENVLGTWDTYIIQSGLYTIKITVTDKVGHISTDSRQLFIENRPIADLAWPHGYLTPTIFTITGTAWDLDFHKYTIEYGQGQNPSAWTSIGTYWTSKQSTTLATWDASMYNNGDIYTLRLTVYDTHSMLSTSMKTIVFDTLPPSPVPVIITADPGVYSVFLSWSASSDISGVTYLIYMKGGAGDYVCRGQTTNTAMGIQNLAASNVYSFYIRAIDATVKYVDSASVTVATEQAPWSAPQPGYCFVGGTKVATPNGEVNIESLMQGDRIISYNERTGKKEMDTVIYTSNHSVGSHLKINALEVTGNHPIYTKNGIKNAENITLGDILIGVDGEVSVTDIEEIMKTVNVYNLEVENNHNYYAGGVLVHNKVWPPSCPYVWVWNGTGYEPDNSLLTSSEDFSKPSSMIDDAYVLQKSMIPSGDKYKLRIMEGELFEISYIDYVALVTVDHDGDFNVGTTLDGDIITYGDPEPPLSCFDKNNANLTGVVSSEENGYYDGYRNDYLVMKFGYDCDKPAKLIIRSDLKCSYDFVPWDAIAPLYGPIEIRILNADGDWILVDSIVPRELWSNDVLDLTPYLGTLTDYLHVNLTWMAHHQVDFVGLDQSANGEYTSTEYSLISAQHSVDGNCIDELAAIDESYKILNCGEYIDFEFPYVAPETEHRDIILYTKGYYIFIQRYSRIDDIDIIQKINVTGTFSGSENNTIEIYFVATRDNASKILGNISMNGSVYQSTSLALNHPVGYGMLMILKYKNAGIGVNCLDVTLQGGLHSRILHFDFNAANGFTQEKIIDLGTIIKEFYENSTTIYYAPHIGKEGLIQPEILIWDFGNGTVITQYDTEMHEFPFTESGNYTVNLTVVFENGLVTNLMKIIEIPNRPPVAVVEAYQEVDITLRVAGRKDNTVTLRILEDGEEIASFSVTRTPGGPDHQAQTITLKKYLGRTYGFALEYSAAHRGSNPTWVIFGDYGGDEDGELEDSVCYYFNFNTRNGYGQTEAFDADNYLDAALAGNHLFHFDASASYDIDGEIISYEWDFGDGTTAQGIAVQHTYSAPGQYTIMLTVTDDDGAIAKESVVVEVR